MNGLTPTPTTLSKNLVVTQSTLAGLSWIPQLFLKAVAAVTTLTAKNASWADQKITGATVVGRCNTKAMMTAKIVAALLVIYRVIAAIHVAKSGDPKHMTSLFLKEIGNVSNLLKTVGIGVLLSGGAAGAVGLLTEPKEVEQKVAAQVQERPKIEWTLSEETTLHLLNALHQKVDQLLLQQQEKETDPNSLANTSEARVARDSSSSSNSSSSVSPAHTPAPSSVRRSSSSTPSSSSSSSSSSAAAAATSRSSRLIPGLAMIDTLNRLGTENTLDSLKEIRKMDLNSLFGELETLQQVPRRNFGTELRDAMINICKAWGHDLVNYRQDASGGAWDGNKKRLGLVGETLTKFINKFPPSVNASGQTINLLEIFAKYKKHIENRPPAVTD